MEPMKPMKPREPITKGSEAAKSWWPNELGTASVSGSSNDLPYFAGKHRLAVDDGQHCWRQQPVGGDSNLLFSGGISRHLLRPPVECCEGMTPGLSNRRPLPARQSASRRGLHE